MINEYLQNLQKFSKTHSVQVSAYSNTWTEWIGLSEFLKKTKQNRQKKKKKKKKKRACFLR